MHYFEFGKRDATIYSGGTTSSINTGFDEILEINKVVANNGSVQNVSRILIDFDLSYISQSIMDGKIPSTAKYYLNLFDATSEEVEASQSIHIYMVSGSWKQGTGKLDHDPVTSDGVSYQYRDHDAKTPWVTGSVLTDGGTWLLQVLMLIKNMVLVLHMIFHLIEKTLEQMFRIWLTTLYIQVQYTRTTALS